MTKPWSPREDEMLSRMRAAKCTVPQIADVLGRRQKDVENRAAALKTPSTVTGMEWNQRGCRPTQSEWPDYWTKNAAEGSAKLLGAMLRFYERRAAA